MNKFNDINQRYDQFNGSLLAHGYELTISGEMRETLVN